MLTPGDRLGPYEIVAPLGAGGMGEVYRARDTRLQREVALKLLPAAVAENPERRARLQREAQLLAALNHPHIAALYGFEQDALAMELVDGSGLAGPLPWEEARPLAIQICAAIEYAHERGIIHRDLKPANIRLTPDRQVKLLDFGLAKALEGETSAADLANSPTLTHMASLPGMILGTAAYMAPEQAKGKAVDRRADIWAFGCILFELLSGRQAFQGETATEVLAAVITQEPDLQRWPGALGLDRRRRGGRAGPGGRRPLARASTRTGYAGSALHRRPAGQPEPGLRPGAFPGRNSAGVRR